MSEPMFESLDATSDTTFLSIEEHEFCREAAESDTQELTTVNVGEEREHNTQLELEPSVEDNINNISTA